MPDIDSMKYWISGRIASKSERRCPTTGIFRRIMLRRCRESRKPSAMIGPTPTNAQRTGG